MFYVYRLDNHSQEESYFGVTNNPDRRMPEHCRGQTLALEHWDFENDDIKVVFLHNCENIEDASGIAHEYEKTGDDAPEGYSIIQTGGV
jgi:predicted GIY-YIG superfamily endonuclease